MPKRVIDFDAMWGSDKLAACAEWAQAEYAWLYGLADASGCFELTNLRVIWGRVAAIRRNLSLNREVERKGSPAGLTLSGNSDVSCESHMGEGCGEKGRQLQNQLPLPLNSNLNSDSEPSRRETFAKSARTGPG